MSETTDAKPFNAYAHRTELPSERVSRPFRDATNLQFIWFGAFFFLALVLWVRGNQVIAGSTSALVAALGAWQYESGTGYEYPGIWKGNRRLARNNFTMQGKNGSAQVIQLIVTDFLGLFGTIFDARRNEDVVLFKMRGFLPANADPEEFSLAEAQINATLKSTVSQLAPNEHMGTGFIRGQRPFNPWPAAEIVDTYFLHPDYKSEAVKESSIRKLRHENPAKFQAILNAMEKDPTLRLKPKHAMALDVETLNDCWSDLAEKGAHYWRVAYIRLKRPKDWRAIAEGNPDDFTQDDLGESGIVDIFTAMQEGFEEAGYDKVSVMNMEELHEFVFSMWNARTAHEAARHGGVISLGKNIPEGSSQYTEWPLTPIKATRNHIVTDGVYHAMFKVTAFGKKFVLPGGMFSFQAGMPRFVMGVTAARTTSQRRDEMLLRTIKNQRQAEIQRRNPGGFIEEYKDRSRAAEDARKLEILQESGAKPIRMNDTYVVSAMTEKDLKKAKKAFKSKMRRQRVTVVEETNSSLMLMRFLALLGVQS